MSARNGIRRSTCTADARIARTQRTEQGAALRIRLPAPVLFARYVPIELEGRADPDLQNLDYVAVCAYCIRGPERKIEMQEGLKNLNDECRNEFRFDVPVSIAYRAMLIFRTASRVSLKVATPSLTRR